MPMGAPTGRGVYGGSRHHLHPRAFCTLPSFACIKKTEMAIRFHGKIGDCEQSRAIWIHCWSWERISVTSPQLSMIKYTHKVCDQILSIMRVKSFQK